MTRNDIHTAIQSGYVVDADARMTASEIADQIGSTAKCVGVVLQYYQIPRKKYPIMVYCIRQKSNDDDDQNIKPRYVSDTAHILAEMLNLDPEYIQLLLFRAI